MAISSPIEKLANLATSASEALPNANPLPDTLAIDPGERSRSADELLLDVRVPKSLSDWLTLPLATLGFSIETVNIPGNPFTQPRAYSVLKNVVGQNSIFHIPNAVLKDTAAWVAVGAAISVGFRLKNQVLIVVSENMVEATLPYETLGKPVWLRDWGIEWKFVSWSYLEQIRTMAQDAQLSFLPQLLNLEKLIADALTLPASPKIGPPEIATLAYILGGMSQFTDNGDQAWRLLMTQAGLTAYIGSLQLGPTPNITAFGLLDQLKNYAPIPEFPNDQALGLLLCQVLKENPSTTDADTIKGILRKFNLAPTRTY